MKSDRLREYLLMWQVLMACIYMLIVLGSGIGKSVSTICQIVRHGNGNAEEEH
jgi:hypothetical protein